MDLPGGVITESYTQDMAIVRTGTQKVLLTASLILLFSLPLFANSHLLSLVNVIGITLIAVMGLNILTGYCGQVNIGQSAFMAIGAFISAILNTKLGIPFWFCLPVAGLFTALLGVVFGLASFRVKGFYLALVTLAAHFFVPYVILALPRVTGGSLGLIIPRPTLGTMVIKGEQAWFYIIIICALLLLIFAKNLTRTRTGRAFIAIRDNDLAASANGINVFGYKLLAFFICCFYAGIAGSLWATYLGTANIDQYGVIQSIWFLGMLIVGGMGSVTGAVLGTVFMKILDELLVIASPIVASWFPAIEIGLFASMGMLVYGIIIALFLIFEPHGLNRIWLNFKAYYRLWPFSYR